MALWGNSDAITVIDDSTVSMAYTSANSGLEAAAGIGSTAWVLTGTFIIGAGSSSAVGFQTVYIDTTQWPGIDPDNDGKIIVNNAAYDITSIAATSVSFASTLPQEILKGDGVLCSDNTILGLKSGVTAGISTSDTVKIQRLTGGYDKHVYSVDNTLVGLATDASGVSGVDTGKYRTSAGWVGVTTYLDNRGELRVKKEVLVAMSGISTGNYPLYDGDAWGAVDPEL